MAHRGVLFLDELPEFRRNVLEVLRQPLEEGVVRLARASQNVVYPCEVMLVAAMNPCPCGYFNVPSRPCTCPPQKVADYHARISGPLLDRIDITLETRPVEPHLVTALKGDELSSAWFRARVEVARARQRERFAQERAVFCNAQMGPRLLRKVCALKPKARAALELSMRLYGFSARAHDRLLKLARSRADLEGHGDIEEEDMLFVIGCRVLDRKDWMGAQKAPRPMGPHKILHGYA
jgi:magnesium chelatase family protein